MSFRLGSALPIPLAVPAISDEMWVDPEIRAKTKADFFREEQKALKPFQPGLFDDLPES